jgi:hypothetical protein
MELRKVFHSEFKRKGNINLGLHCGFQGILLGTDELLKQKLIQRKKSIKLNAMKQSKVVSMYPELQKLLLSVQQMIHDQYQLAENSVLVMRCVIWSPMRSLFGYCSSYGSNFI